MGLLARALVILLLFGCAHRVPRAPASDEPSSREPASAEMRVWDSIGPCSALPRSSPLDAVDAPKGVTVYVAVDRASKVPMLTTEPEGCLPMFRRGPALGTLSEEKLAKPCVVYGGKVVSTTYQPHLAEVFEVRDPATNLVFHTLAAKACQAHGFTVALRPVGWGNP